MKQVTKHETFFGVCSIYDILSIESIPPAPKATVIRLTQVLYIWIKRASLTHHAL